MIDGPRTARLMQPHLDTLSQAGSSPRDTAHALFSLVEHAANAFDVSEFWELHAFHIAGDQAGFDKLLNTVLEKKA